MGSSTSQEDTDPLLENDEEILPIFEELKLVLIGCNGAGKNTIANAIFEKEVFTFWTSYTSVHIKETCTASGMQIHLARTPGWNGELSRAEQTKREIVHCVQTLYDTGPHAVILVLNVNSVLSIESTISTLESLLTVQLWDHTIVMFTNGEKLGHYSIEDHIRSEQLQPLIDKCGKRYFVVHKNDSKQIIETIQELIVRKNSTSFFKLTAQTKDDNTLLSDWEYVIKRIRSKITSLSAFKEKLQNEDSMKMIFDAKDAEIRRLETIVQEKEMEIGRLQSRRFNTQDLELSDLSIRNTELEDQVYKMSNELKGKNTENKTLKKQVKEKDAEIEELRKELQVWRQEAVGSALQRWSDALLKILNELSDEDLKKMKYSMFWNEEYRTYRGSVEHRDRVELADLMLKQWGERQSVLKARDLVKKIPRNDDAMIELFEPFLKSIGETW
ncbi:GTPase IMAP family member 4-like [Carassius auratus]|uniref:GTPase IMAP family member 4-like n=1 Tax=Carassius auratus TaxID=7957 RepID=A0A6P6NEX4_CARAU|nr:GTPase IMAP family member 4-like [Carassius auratus]